MAPQPAPAESMLSLRPDVVATVLHEGAVLLDLESKFFYSLNTTGWIVAQQFEDGATASQVHRHCQGLGASAQDVAGIDALIKSLLDHGLLERGDAPSASASTPASVTPAPSRWVAPTVVKHAQPLQRVMVTAFDPGIPFTE